MNIEELCKLTDELFCENGGPLYESDLTLERLRASAKADWIQKYPEKIEKINENYKILQENDVEFFLEHQWGGEDQGSSYGVVWKVVHEGTPHLIMKTAWYASHYGTDDWTDAKVATPKEVTTIEYE